MPGGHDISLFGPGALGRALSEYIKEHGHTLYTIWGREEHQCRMNVGSKMISTRKPFPQYDEDLGEWIFLAVPDDQIAAVVDALATLPLQWTRYSIAHFSGNRDSSALKQLAKKGAKTASVHPLQTFTRGDGADRFYHITLTLEGDDDFLNELDDFFGPSGSKTVRLTPKQKQAMHVAAVFTSNYMTALLYTAQQVGEKEEIRDVLSLLQPIIRQTVENLLAKGPAESVSGPLARGDENTVKEHLKLLKGSPSHKELYSLLGRQLLDLLEHRDESDPDQLATLRNILSLTGEA
ncbi:MAG: Rossmann-like and DUF2520 domain-containing protein [Balneolaceae bacterium]